MVKLLGAIHKEHLLILVIFRPPSLALFSDNRPPLDVHAKYKKTVITNNVRYLKNSNIRI